MTRQYYLHHGQNSQELDRKKLLLTDGSTGAGG